MKIVEGRIVILRGTRKRRKEKKKKG